MEHSEWLVPIHFFPQGELQSAHKVAFGPRHQIPPAELWVFSEQGTAQQAFSQGALLGAYVASVPGCRLFRGVPEDITRVKINGGGFDEDLLEFDRAGFDQLSEWAATIDLEASFADPDGNACRERIRKHAAYHVPLMPDGRMIAKPGHGGFAQPGVICTSADNYEAFVGALEPELAAQLTHSIVDGGGLWRELGGQEVDALYINPFGPGRTVTLPRNAAAPD